MLRDKLKDDVDLVLRDHSHTDFHTGNQESSKCQYKIMRMNII